MCPYMIASDGKIDEKYISWNIVHIRLARTDYFTGYIYIYMYINTYIYIFICSFLFKFGINIRKKYSFN